jgi:hypothetical protein
MKKLQVGDKVTLKNGKTHTISAISYGGSEAEGNTSYYRWDVEWPYDIVHNAMNPDEHSIVLENRPYKTPTNMKRLNRREIIEEFEYLRQGFASGHQRSVENQDRLLVLHQRACHGNANNYIAKLGGERVELPDLEKFLDNTPTK